MTYDPNADSQCFAAASSEFELDIANQDSEEIAEQIVVRLVRLVNNSAANRSTSVIERVLLSAANNVFHQLAEQCEEIVDTTDGVKLESQMEQSGLKPLSGQYLSQDLPSKKPAKKASPKKKARHSKASRKKKGS